MLSSLHIENIAVIESADIEFRKGFHVLTGETGAGKSIIIDAINAILGERTYRDLIRTGENCGSVSAVFEDIPDLPWFDDNGVPFEAGEILIDREIYQDGKNRCRVNGKAVTVSLLRDLGTQLISIHGQHDSQQLFDESTHIDVLDSFAELEQEKSAYVTCYEHFRSVSEEIRRLSIDEGEKIRRTEILRRQIEEIDAAELKIGEDDEIEEKRKLLQNAERISDGLNNAYHLLSGGMDSDGASGLISDADYELSRIEQFTSEIAEINQTLNQAAAEVEAVIDSIRGLKDSLDFSPDELERLDDRWDFLKKFKRKYGSSIEDILSFRDSAEKELNEIEFSDETIARLKGELEDAKKAAVASAEQLSDRRRSFASVLENRIRKELSELDMPGVQFLCLFEKTDLGPNGSDSVSFLMSANAGEALKPMSKVASGGELARIMLAIKNVLAEKDSVPTLIFDEVDTGVSGRAAQKIANKLKSVSQNKQVLCVSHLPQIAAAADVHLLISKAQKNGRTFTSVTPLDKQGRIEEISRIIGGRTITDITRRSAEEMLDIANN